MEPFHKLTRIAAQLRLVNVDTIIPKQYLKRVVRTGLSEGPLLGEAAACRWQPRSCLSAQHAALCRREHLGRRRQFRLRLFAQAGSVGGWTVAFDVSFPRFWHHHPWLFTSPETIL